MSDTPVIYLIDDDASVRKALERLLVSAGYRVESFANARNFLAQPVSEEKGCVLLDLAMPDINGLDVQSALADMDNALPIVFLTGHGDIPASVEAMKAGAVDFLTKPVDEEALLGAIAAALEQRRTAVAERENSNALQRRFESLSPREAEVMHLVVTGMLNKQIAADLGISEKTVKVHRARVMEKTGSHSLAELVRLCADVERAGNDPAT